MCKLTEDDGVDADAFYNDEVIVDALLTLDAQILDVDRMNSLLQGIPEETELEAIKTWAANPENGNCPKLHREYEIVHRLKSWFRAWGRIFQGHQPTQLSQN